MHLLEIAEIIKQRREVLLVTQEDLSELADVGLRTVKALETGKSNPTLKTLNKLIEVLGLELKVKVKNLN